MNLMHSAGEPIRTGGLERMLSESPQMKRQQFVQALACVPLASTPTRSLASVRDFAAIKKSLWVWRTPLEEYAALSRFTKAFGFDTLFVSLSNEDRSRLRNGDPDALSAAQALRSNGKTVWTVAGDPSWTADSGIPAPIPELLAINERFDIFDGLMLDVEPHSNVQWLHGEREAILADYVSFLEGIARKTNSLGLPIGAAIHPTYASYAVGAVSALSAAARVVDHVVVMAYRRDPQRAVDAARLALADLSGTRCKWWFGLSSDAREPQSVSYKGMSARALGVAAGELDETLQGRFTDARYRGLSVHDYESIATILEA